MQLNAKQQHAFDSVLKGKNMYISGPGGVGKSFTIKKIIDAFPDSTVLLAPTGIAALNIGGSTVHSTFKLSLGIQTKHHHTRINENTQALFEVGSPVQRIIIDEVSMLRQDVFVCIDEQLKRIRRSSKPFGGLQMIVVGDFYQLPPVVTRSEQGPFSELYESVFAFGGESWSRANFEHVELDQVMRQTDEVFIGHLQKIRQKANGFAESLTFLNDHATNNIDRVLEMDPVFLCTTNASADAINEEHYNQLDGEERVYRAIVDGEFKEQPAPRILKLKYGAKVMMTANSDTYKNGTIGYVTGFVGDKIEVTFEHPERTELIEQHVWESFDYTVTGDKLVTFPTGTFKQYPMKLAYATTTHKAQGLTLEAVVIEPGRGFFASGQLYVALSRAKTLEGLAFMNRLLPRDVIVDASIQEFYKQGCRGIGL